MGLGMGLLGAEEAKFAGGAVGAKAVGEVKGGSGAGGDGWGVSRRAGWKSTEGEEAGGFVEAEAGAQLAGGGSDDAAAEGRVEGTEAVEFDGDGGLAGSGADGAAAATDGFAGEEELGQDAA
jgi:hypothetical protein